MTMADTLTPDAVLAMPAGAELDEVVATRVLGWKWGQCPDSEKPLLVWMDRHGEATGTACSRLSGDFGESEYVLDWLRERWGCVQMRVDRYDVIVWPLGGPHTTADTLPLALCRAALLEVIAEGKS